MLVSDVGSFEKGESVLAFTWKFIQHIPIGVDFTSPVSSMLGNGIFTSDGEAWK